MSISVRSMTGYATNSIHLENSTILFEIRSVNHRFFDISIKTPEDLRYLEPLIRETINGKFVRGKFDIKITHKFISSDSSTLTLNTGCLNQYIGILQQIEQKIGTSNLSATQILSLPGVVTCDTTINNSLYSEIQIGLHQLLKDLLISLEIEGKKLSTILINKIKQIQNIIDEANTIIPDVIDSYKNQLKQKLTNTLSETIFNEQRFQQEFIYFCQKIDVDEELTRLQSHTQQFMNIITTEECIGKKLEFVTQEMQREANTFGAKSVSIKTSNLAINLKIIIEQIKEQLQNIA